MRTKLADRQLPNYSKNEELFNSVSHIVGGALSVVILVVCIVLSAIHGNVAGILTSIVYGISGILLYTMSSIYHGLPKGNAKKVLQVLDHCSIYILIAGTYTPITICSIVPVNATVGWILFGVEWFLAALAITFNAIDFKRYAIFAMLCNLIMGWAVIVVPQIALEALGVYGFAFILGGGILYTIGAILYGIGSKKTYMHCVFHIFVLLGSIAHALGIILYVI